MFVILEWYKKHGLHFSFSCKPDYKFYVIQLPLLPGAEYAFISPFPDRRILIMVEEFWHRKIGIAVTCSCWILLVFFTVQFFHGSWDIYNTYAKCMARDRLAKEQIAAGEKNLTLPVVIPETEYAALKGLADLDVANQYVWNNAAMAAYYQVESIIGVAE